MVRGDSYTFAGAIAGARFLDAWCHPTTCVKALIVAACIYMYIDRKPSSSSSSSDSRSKQRAAGGSSCLTLPTPGGRAHRLQPSDVVLPPVRASSRPSSLVVAAGRRSPVPPPPPALLARPLPTYRSAAEPGDDPDGFFLVTDVWSRHPRRRSSFSIVFAARPVFTGRAWKSVASRDAADLGSAQSWVARQHASSTYGEFLFEFRDMPKTVSIPTAN